MNARLFLDAAYLTAGMAASPLVAAKMLVSPRWRNGFAQRLGSVPRRADRGPCIWVHAASVGEVLAVRALLPRIEALLPDHQIVLSTTTPEGNRTAREKLKIDPFFYPIDFSPCVKKTLSRIRPQMILLVEREIWPNFVSIAHDSGVPVLMINGIVSESFVSRFRRLKALHLDCLPSIARFAVQNETYRQRLLSLGVEDARIAVTGNIKYDNLPTEPDQTARDAMRRTLGIDPDDWLFVAGSTRETEEEAIVSAFAQLHKTVPHSRLVLVPRHTSRKEEVARVVRGAKLTPVFKTDLDRGAASPTGRETVIVVDTFGELEAIYSVASAVFVGGTLTPESGGHNFLEPAAFSRPIIVGPHVRNFRQAADSLLAKDAIVMVQSSASIAVAMRGLASEPEKAVSMGARAARVVRAHRGATDRTAELVRGLTP